MWLFVKQTSKMILHLTKELKTLSQHIKTNLQNDAGQ